jgi:predicted ATPase
VSAPTPQVSAGLRLILTALRLGQMVDTLPERLATARECSMPHVDAAALGHISCRRRSRVHFERAGKPCKRLKAARLDHSAEAELRKLISVDLLLIIDDFALHPLGATATNDFYELVVERHRKGATVITSNRDPSELLAQMADPLLAQSAIDRLQSAAYELVIEGEFYRTRQKPRTRSETDVTETRRTRTRPTG